jgi:adenine-specific DNA-methyltransferase
MARSRKPDTKPIEQYDHKDKKRCNNPPVGLVTPETDKDGKAKVYQYDPHLDPQLIWAGKAEHTSFEVPTVSLHVHERIDPKTIIKAVQRRSQGSRQVSLFELSDENPPIRSAIDFYKHRHNWSNRLIAGDSLLVMNSLLEKEGMAGQVQTIYIDPPYGIRYGSNFQPFVNKRDVKDGKDEDLTQEPEMIKAFRDTWELGIHSYLAYLRDRLLLARELLSESGSVFVQISDENLHHVRELMDEVFGSANFVTIINFRSMMPLASSNIESVYDYVVWFSKNKSTIKYRNLWSQKAVGGSSEFIFADSESKGYRKLDKNEIFNIQETLKTEKVFKRSNLSSSGYTPSCTFQIEYDKEIFNPVQGKSWRTTADGVQKLIAANRIFKLGEKLYFKLYHSDFGFNSLRIRGMIR